MTEQARIMCSVWRSPRKEGMYLYMRKGTGVESLPAPLAQVFGPPVHVMDMLLRPGISLARADLAEVMAAITEQGFYLQMPPADQDSDLYLKHSRA